jgi:hypothetical protein
MSVTQPWRHLIIEVKSPCESSGRMNSGIGTISCRDAEEVGLREESAVYCIGEWLAANHYKFSIFCIRKIPLDQFASIRRFWLSISCRTEVLSTIRCNDSILSAFVLSGMLTCSQPLSEFKAEHMPHLC